ncbi:hypothetical protein BKA63DRAFT_406902 [Paraphoma chrysanthemicola]|nr:hypothetical protein BKA63DRAFT_406902 [Paraphoma chrysanthemicola]
MPPLLHPHLKRGLDLDDFHIDPEDIIEDVPRGALDPEEQIAKRRRIERIAAQCLRGRRPVILAAGLRGPFDEGWKNPWAKAKKCTRRHSKEGDSTKDNKTRTEAEKVSNGIGHAQTRTHSRRAARGVTQAEAVASPETSRAVGDDVEDMNDTYTLEAIEIPPATAPSSDENDVSGATDQEEVHVQLQRSQHDLAASSAPNSSTSFAHKKVATKWTINNAPRSKPRAVNFNSSPSIKNGTKSSSRVSVAKEGMNGHPSVVADMPSQAEEGLVGNQNHDQEQQNTSTACRRSSDHSMMSTQAAMLLAQLEFQESTYPTSSHGTYRPWSQIPDETPRSIMPELSPAITPLSMFRPQLEQPDALTSVLRDAPISTQELFAAASPFAFSTVKKKPIAPQHSNLRVTTLSFDATEQRSGDTAPQSPSSSAGRRPLQEKNTLPSPWKRTFGKGARGSQTVKTNRSSFCSDVESPRLGLDGPMGSYGSDESFHPANHLLCDLQGT